MMTFKQLEAVYWIVHLGSFAQAARKLHTTQSAVSKRVQELEALVHAPLFDRTARSARLTEMGEEVLVMAERLLNDREELMRRLLKGEAQERHVRIGVTEVTAMTWLPRWVERIHEEYPKLTIDPQVDTGAGLRDKLLANEVDVMVAADTFRDDRFKVTTLSKLSLHWMCKPGIVTERASPMPLQVLENYRILTQGQQSGTGLLFQDWFKGQGLKAADLVESNSLLALVGLTVSGFGISYLPLAPAQAMLDAGLLAVLDVKPRIPDATYAALIRREQPSSVVSAIVRLAKETCNFSTPYQTASLRPRRRKAASKRPQQR